MYLAVDAAVCAERFGGSTGYAELIAKHRPVVRPLEEELTGDVAGPLWELFGSVAVVADRARQRGQPVPGAGGAAAAWAWA